MTAKKLALVIITSLSKTVTSNKASLEPKFSILNKPKLQLMLYIYYLVQFNKEPVEVFIDKKAR